MAENQNFAAYDYVAAREAAMSKPMPTEADEAAVREADTQGSTGNKVTDPRPDFLKKKESASAQNNQQSKSSGNKKKAKENKAEPSQEPTRAKASEDTSQAETSAKTQSDNSAAPSKAEKLAAKAKGESTASKKASSGSGRKKKFSDNAVIRVKPEYKNPDAAKKPKTKAHKMYSILTQCDGMTVADYQKALDNQWPDRPASYSATHELDWCANKKAFITVEEPEAEAEAA